jgi:acetate kinase
MAHTLDTIIEEIHAIQNDARAGRSAGLLKLDGAKNAQTSADQDISLSDSTVRVLVVHAQEDWVIARDCWRLISARSQGHATVV